MNTEVPLNDWLMHVASKGAVVLAVALLAGCLLRRVAAARRYAVWLTAVAGVAVLPLAVMLLPAWRVLPQAAEPVWVEAVTAEKAGGAGTLKTAPRPGVTLQTDAPQPAALPAAAVIPSVSKQASWSPSWEQARQSLPWLWLTVTALFLLRLAWGGWRLRWLEQTLDTGRCAMLDTVAQELGFKRAPELLVGAADAVPMVWGVWHPRLLLPQGFDAWSPAKLRSVLLHELAHLQRRDPLALWISQWVKALHWFNPLAWLTLRQLRADQERACDDAALRHGVRPSDYAQHLLDLSHHTRLAPGLGLCALTITRCAPVEARVKAVLDAQRPREGLTLRWLAGMAGLMLLTTLPVAMLHAIEPPALRGRILDSHGVVLAESQPNHGRHYPLGTLVPHAIAYASGPNANEPGSKPRGRAALEKRHDAQLNDGQDLVLTLDMRMQALATRVMQEAGITRGAAVILNPNTGEILASVSLPAYDPNLFAPSITEDNWKKVLADTDLPLLDRATSKRTSAGDLLLPLTALATFLGGQEPGVYSCTPLGTTAGGGARFGAVTKLCQSSILNSAAHGPLTLEQALSRTCSSYFYQAGDKAGYGALLTMADHLGLQSGMNVFGDSAPPLLPNAEEMKEKRPSERQQREFTADVSGGRSGPVSPLQMALLYAALANGKVWEPSYVQDGEARQPRTDLNSLPGMPAALARVRAALQDAVRQPEGRAHSAASAKVSLAALADVSIVGTRGPHSDVFHHHHWLAGYAPADKPALAFALYADLQSPERVRAEEKLGPAARRLMEQALALPADSAGPSPFSLPTSKASLEAFASDLAKQPQKLAALTARYSAWKEHQAGRPAARRLSDAAVMDLLSAPPAAVKVAPDDAIRLQPHVAAAWRLVKNAGLLADLPTTAVVDQKPLVPTTHTVFSPSFHFFRFSAPRADVHAWLTASMSETMRKVQAERLRWPEGRFFQRYQLGLECDIAVFSFDGKTVEVIISKPQKVLDAPDFDAPPQPPGKLLTARGQEPATNATAFPPSS